MAVFMIKQAFVNLYLQKKDFTYESVTPSAVEHYIENLMSGWVGTGNGVWTPETPALCYSDLYDVRSGHQYWLTLGDKAGTRFRVMFSTLDVSKATGQVTGVPVNTSNYNNPAPHQNLYYSPDDNGFLIVQKDNAGNSDIKTYLYDYGLPHVLSYPLCSVEPDADPSHIMNVVNALLPCLELSGQLLAVKKIEGYKFIVT